MAASINLGPFGKCIVAACGVAAVVLSDNVFDLNDATQIVLAVLTALGVYAVPNVSNPKQPPG